MGTLGPSIAEDKLAEAEEGREDAAPLSTPRHAKRSSQNRLSKLSDDARVSMQSIRLVDSNGTNSNRSSTTIKGTQINGTAGASFTDDEFDKALRKFASERDTFLTDLEMTAGAVVKPKVRPKTQKIVGEEPTNLKSAVGSIRRRISFRDIGSMKRQPSMARQGLCPSYAVLAMRVRVCLAIRES